MYKIKNTELDFESRIFHLHKIFYSALYSDLNGCITDITLAFPEGLTVTDDDVSLILSTAQKKCKLQFPIEGIYKYKDWAIYDYVFYLTN